MTGRQLLRRSGYEVDVEKVLKACADHGVAVEINANPWRLDLDLRCTNAAWSLVACSASAMEWASGLMSTSCVGAWLWRAKGDISADRVLNALDLHGFSQWLADRRNHTAPPSAKIGESAHPAPVRSGRFAAIRPTRQRLGLFKMTATVRCGLRNTLLPEKEYAMPRIYFFWPD
jgi:hypothetical protein